MALARKYASFHEPRRVQILRGSKTGTYFKPGQFAYALGWDERGGQAWLDKVGSSRAGQRAYLVAKSKDARGGAVWFSAAGIRFTKTRGASPAHVSEAPRSRPAEVDRTSSPRRQG